MPFEIPVTATNFGAPFQPPPAGNLLPRFRNCDLVRAAIMAGHPNGAGNAPDPRIRAWRTTTIKLAVQHSAGNRLIHPRAWQRLDPTEKGQVRNLLGNTITKLLCERYLQAPLMVFLDVYGKDHGFVYQGKKPDFIAQTLAGSWFTIEAKGRDRMTSQTKLTRVKQQQAQAQPAAAPGLLEAHVVSWIGQRWNSVHAALHDPEPFSEGGFPPLETAALVEAYYAPVLSILRKDRAWAASPSDLVVTVEGADLGIGLHPKIAWLLQTQHNEGIPEILRYIHSGSSNDTSFTKEGYGPDGVKIVLGESWGEEYEQ